MCYKNVIYNKPEFKKNIEYFENTNDIKKIYYRNNDGSLNGEYIEFYESGKLWVHCFYNKDQLVDIFKLYDEDGNISYAYDYNTNNRVYYY